MEKYFKEGEDFKSIIVKNLEEKFNIKRLKSISKISTGWTNLVYKAETDQGTFYFRFPRDEFWERTIVKDYEFAKYINKKTSFVTVLLYNGQDQNRNFSIHKEIEGKALAEVMNDLNESEIINISKDVAKFMYEMHTLNYDEKEIFTINNIGLNLNDFIDELLKKHVSQEDMLFWEKDNFISDKQTVLVHGDLNSSNILVDANNKFKAVIDFGFGGFGNKYLDIGRIIGRCPIKFKEHLIYEYEKLLGKKLDLEYLDKIILIWNKIDNSYINYMKNSKIIGENDL